MSTYQISFYTVAKVVATVTADSEDAAYDAVFAALPSQLANPDSGQTIEFETWANEGRIEVQA